AKAEPQISTWPDWRGAARDGRVKQLPATLPATPRIVWRRPLGSPGLGGVSATMRHVFVTQRELNDTTDVFCCLDAATGEEVWRHAHPAIGQLDYGNSPRATPIVSGDSVYLQGAHGTIHCVDAATGELRWQFDMWSEFDVAPTPKWGACATPLLVDGKLIINPGAKLVSLAALDAKTGAIIWRTAGEEAGYGSFIVATLGGKRQIVGHDTNSLGGWDVATGKRLWRLAPPKPGDFNVPTPIVVGQELIVLTENNGTRRFRFDDQGKVIARPVATYDDLKPDTQSAVVSGSRLIGAGAGLHCLDLKQGLESVWVADEAEFHVHTSLIADDRRVLALTLHGGLMLIDSQSDNPRVLGRMQ
ncbi:MAG TPA: PQQ-like beta-propeller repeat protein, partial [Pirellulaceae bacterium]|nr:PQQ-like beta-propeller repeat protein [Pirellulaceae bacterium]